MPAGVPIGLPYLFVPGLVAAVPGVRTVGFLASHLLEGVTSRDPETARAPRPELSVGLAAKVGMDEVLLSAMLGFLRAPYASELRRIRAEVEAAAALFDQRGWLEDPSSFHRAPPPAVIERETEARFRGLAFRHVEFHSGFEPREDVPGRRRWMGHGGNRTAHAWMLRHPGKERPWVVCTHGYRMGLPATDLSGFRAEHLYYRLGLNVICPVLPLHGPRRHGWRSGEGYLAGDVMDTIHAQTQAIWDLRRVLRWIEASGAPSIAAYGLSLGGYTTALLATLEPHLACVIAGIPATCFYRMMRTHMPAPIRRYVDWHGFDWQTVERVFSVVSPLASEPLVAKDRRFLFAGTADRLVPPDHVHELWEHWERPRIQWYQGSHMSFRWESSVDSLVDEVLGRRGLLTAGLATR